MNLQQLRCVLEIARVGSVTKAAQNLYISQPNLSRTIKELEKELGVSLFRRGAQGMEPTVEAAQLLRYAETILRQVGELESIYRTHEQTMRLALAGPHSGYITRALASFLAKQQGRPLNVSYQESATAQALDAVSRGQVQIAVVRYQLLYDDYFKELFAKAGLASRTLLRFNPCVLMAPDHPLAGQELLDYEQLQQYPQILRGDAQLAERTEFAAPAPEPAGRIHVQDRASMYELLRGVPGSYAWSNPLPEAECRRQGLVQRRCAGVAMNRDVALWQAKYGCRLWRGTVWWCCRKRPAVRECCCGPCRKPSRTRVLLRQNKEKPPFSVLSERAVLFGSVVHDFGAADVFAVDEIALAGVLQGAKGVAGIKNHVLLIRLQIIGRAIGIQCHLHVYHLIMVLAVIGGDYDLVTQLHIFKIPEVAVGVGSGQNGTALTGDMCAGVGACALAQLGFAVAPVHGAVHIGAGNHDAAQLVAHRGEAAEVIQVHGGFGSGFRSGTGCGFGGRSGSGRRCGGGLWGRGEDSAAAEHQGCAGSQCKAFQEKGQLQGLHLVFKV